MIGLRFPVYLVSMALGSAPLPDPSSDNRVVVFDARRPSVLARSERWVREDLARTHNRPECRAEYAESLAMLGSLRRFAGDQVSAHKAFSAAYQIHVKHLDPNSSAALNAAENLASLSGYLGLHADAEQYHRAAWQIRGKLRRDDVSRSQASKLSDLARLYTAAGRHDLAERCVRRAIDLQPEAKRSDSDLAMDYLTLGKAYTQTGRFDQAKRVLAAAGDMTVVRGGIDLQMARCCVATGDDRAAKILLLELNSAESTHHWMNRRFLTDIRVVLAGIVTREGDPDRGKMLLLTAIHFYERTGGPRSPDYAGAVATYRRLFPDDRTDVADHVAAIRAAAHDEEMKGPEYVLCERP